MTETDDLNRDIKALKELLKIAWQDLASKSLTPYEFREKRNEMDRCAAELRGLLNALEAERRRAGPGSRRNPNRAWSDCACWPEPAKIG